MQLWDIVILAASQSEGAAAEAEPTLGTPIAFTNNINTTVADQGSGVYRITKTSGTDELRNARANSASSIAGDFLITLHDVVEGDAEFTDGFVGANNAQLTTNAPSAIEVALNAARTLGASEGVCSAHVPGGTVLVGQDFTPASEKAFIRRLGGDISFRKGAAWDASTEYATATMSGDAWCSILLDTINGYVEVTFQPIE